MSIPILMIRKGSTGRPFHGKVQYSDGTTANLTDATIKFYMSLVGSTTKKIDAATAGITILDQGTYQGEFTYTFQDADVNEVCPFKDETAETIEEKYVLYEVECEITLSGGLPFMAPANPLEPWRVLITDSIATAA